MPVRLLAMLLLGAAVWLQVQLDARLGGFRSQEEVLYLGSGDQVRRLFPGLEDVMADLYWLRTVQYFGGKVAFEREKRFDLLEPLVQITTTLDPRLELAYRYGAIFLAEHYPNGAGQPEAAARLLRKGIAANPENWRLHWDLGYFQYLFLKDPQAGAETLIQAAKIPGAPQWLMNLAAGMITWRGEERAMARVLWRQILAEAEAEPIRRNAELHLQYLDARDRMDALDAAIERFRELVGRPPHSLGDLEAAFDLPVPVEDPAGERFAYDRDAARVRIARQSPLWRLQPPEAR